ncbi:MAG: hypothetical protein AUJ96_01650 [Armatimonadetes bacterium CG2_30_66_41]|nr:hypothetical protein [Armatimonadota bacterium]OIP11801.1 MAG: hypothetical protein AUJ96_01650 [Armatimonadetes bacterium CG2_30_66_41]NCO94689.1 hypothetical protein [Armatimonadota bacterium]NCP34231.1 hypothetical protein [Armatimonadota bacterium]NCQ31785.1 hypothetical protein [Armatimonadota bacterium]
MAYRDAAVEVPVRVAAAPGTYRLYDFFADTEELRTAEAGGLSLSLRGRSCALLYFGADTAEWRARLVEIRDAAKVAFSPEPSHVAPAG